MKYVWYFLKQMFFPLVYMVILSITSIGITAINNDLMWLKYILNAIVLAFFALIIGAVSWKDGEEGAKVLHANDLERRRIVETGEDRPLNLLKEYRPWKGFLAGLSTCVPLIIMIIIHAIMSSTGAGNGAGAVAGFVYMIVFMFFMPDLNMTLTASHYYLTLTAIPIFMVITGVAYILGYRKIQKQYQSVERKQNQIYGDK